MCSFVILLLSNEMQMSVRRFSAIPHLRGAVSNNARMDQEAEQISQLSQITNAESLPITQQI